MYNGVWGLPCLLVKKKKKQHEVNTQAYSHFNKMWGGAGKGILSLKFLDQLSKRMFMPVVMKAWV